MFLFLFIILLIFLFMFDISVIGCMLDILGWVLIVMLLLFVLKTIIGG